MKNLNEILNETMSIDDLKKFIISNVQNSDLDEITLVKTYKSIAKKLNIETEKTIYDADDVTLSKYIVSRNISKIITKTLIRMFKEYDSIHILNYIADNEIQLPSSSEVFQNNTGDVIEYFENYNFINKNTNESFKLPKDLLLELADLTTQGIGKFEILCDLLFQDIKKGGSGDLNTENLGTMELKCNGGRVMYKDIKSVSVIDDAYEAEFSQFLGARPQYKEKNGYFCNKEIILKQIEELKYYYKDGDYAVSIENISSIIGYPFLCQHNTYSEAKKYLQDTINFLLDKKIVYKKGNDIDIDINGLQRFIGCVQLYFYNQVDKWNYMVVLSNTDKNRHVVNGKYKIIPSTLLQGSYKNALNNIWDIKEIRFTGWPKSGKNISAQDNAVHIELVK